VNSVTLWLLGVRQSAKGKTELIVCANQKDPVLVLSLKALTTRQDADTDAPVQISVETAGKKHTDHAQPSSNAPCKVGSRILDSLDTLKSEA
jgi:hypothetical protein